MPALTRRTHFYAGLFIAPFILIAALSGALYAIAPTLENVVYKDVVKVVAPEDGTGSEVPLGEQVKAAQAVHPDLDVAQVWPSSKADESTRVLLIDESLADNGELRRVFVNPYNGAVLDDVPSYSGLGELPLRHWISATHKNLHLGQVGELYSELAASWMWVVALGGLFLWWRIARKRALTGIKNKNGHRRKVFSLHGVLGTWLLVGMLGLSATGITWSVFAGNNVDRTITWLGGKAEPIETSLAAEPEAVEAHAHAEHDHSGAGATNSLPPALVANQAATVLETARAEGLTGQVRLLVPEDENHAWQTSERWVPWRFTSDAVSINGDNGDVVDRLPFSELPLFSKLTQWGIYLHMGIMFGLPLQIALEVLALGICAMVVMGYIMWWRRRPTKNGVAGVPGQADLSRKDWVLLALIAIPVGLFLPLLGISFAAMLAVDRLLARRQKDVVASDGNSGAGEQAGHKAEKELQPA